MEVVDVGEAVCCLKLAHLFFNITFFSNHVHMLIELPRAETKFIILSKVGSGDKADSEVERFDRLDLICRHMTLWCHSFISFDCRCDSFECAALLVSEKCPILFLQVENESVHTDRTDGHKDDQTYCGSCTRSHFVLSTIVES